MSETSADVKSILGALKKKKFGFDVTTLDDESSPCVVGEWMSTGCVALDSILGGGLPVGRVVEIYGDNSTGKSLIAAQVAALAQESGDIVAYADTESAVSKTIMEAVGIDFSNMIYLTPDTVEEVFEFFDATIDAKSSMKDKRLLLIWDSIAATSVDTEIKQVYGKATMGKHAQVISQSMRKIIRKISKNRVCVLFLNQTREKIGVMFGDNVTTFGGKAVGFYASIRVQLKYGQKLKEEKKVVGMQARATVTKNKVAIPFKRCTLPIYFGHGIDDTLASFDYLKEAGLLERSGKYYKIKGLSDIDSFTSENWEETYDKNYDVISQLIMESEIEDDTEDSDDSEE